MKLAEKIKEIRKASGLTQVQFAEKLGVKQTTVGRYENGKILPSLAVLIKMGKEFNHDVSNLLALYTISSKRKFSIPKGIISSNVYKFSSEELSQYRHNKNLLNLDKNHKKKILQEIEDIKRTAQELIEKIIILEEMLKK